MHKLTIDCDPISYNDRSKLCHALIAEGYNFEENNEKNIVRVNAKMCGRTLRTRRVATWRRQLASVTRGAAVDPRSSGFGSLISSAPPICFSARRGGFAWAISSMQKDCWARFRMRTTSSMSCVSYRRRLADRT